MELHQVRYFLSLSKTLNFTRAAEECNVSQPALSRAISQLEGELGGELFRRERSLTHLTDLGQAVLPVLRQCYEASQNARAMAREFCKEGHAPLNLALSRSFEMKYISPLLAELAEAYPRIEIRLTRGPPQEIVEKLRNGEAEIAICGPLPNDWDRLDAKMLFEEQFGLLLGNSHRLSRQNIVELNELKNERLLCRPYCTVSETLLSRLKEAGAHNIIRHDVPLIEDLPGLVQANFGVGVWPVARLLPGGLMVNRIQGLDLTRWIQVYSVAGRRHSAAATTLVALLRSRDWGSAASDEYTAPRTVQ